MKIIFFDLCSIPIYLLIMVTYFRRRMARYQAYRMFYLMTFLSMICAILNTSMEFVVNPTPLSRASVVAGTLMSFSYKWLRACCMVVYLLFIFAITRTENKIQPKKIRILIWMPAGILLLILIQNFFTGNVFSVTAEDGYSRGPMLMALYAVTAIYAVFGVWYCIHCRRFLDKGKLFSLLMVFALTAAAVYVQFILPNYMVEMYFTSIGLLILMLLVVRPEESIDSSVGAQSWQSFQADLHTMLLSRSKTRIGVFQIPNAHQIRNHLGDQLYFAYIRQILDAMQEFTSSLHVNEMLYFEHPSNIYIMLDECDCDMEMIMSGCLKAAKDSLKKSGTRSMRFHPVICMIRCPEDLTQESEIIKLCHSFSTLGARNQTWFKASDIVDSRDFEIEIHIEDILIRAIQDNTLQIYYQPIYDTHEKKFRSAEALARITDSEYGMISPAIFIPAAERSGLILRLGNSITESVFRFISEHDLAEMGLEYIEINLSVEQLRQNDLIERITNLQQKYGVSPHQVNFEITESVFDSFVDVVEMNMRRLAEMGYTFSLDDYGTGYSNLQRLRKLPLSIIKIDKSLVDDMFTDDGRIVMSNTMSMMQGLSKKLVAEGVETAESLDALTQMNCDYIQGYYFSKPLPAGEFLEFIERNQ